jgi:endoglucanase
MMRWRAGYRGFNVGVVGNPRMNAGLFADARAYGADLLRAFVPFPGPGASGAAASGRAIRNFVSDAAEAGLSTVLVPDADAESTASLWCDEAQVHAFVEHWAGLAREFRGMPAIAGFDLLNEPNPPGKSPCAATSAALWNGVVRRTVAAIRAEDASVPIVVEGILGGNAQGLLALDRLDDEAIVYSVHFYVPHDITHQRVSSRWPRVLNYPTVDARELAGTWAYPGPWNRERLRAELTAAAERGRSDDIPVYVGEFSCVRWAPGASAARYVEDCLALFAEFGWSWTYHEFRGWPGWDPEAEGDGPSGPAHRVDAPVIRLLSNAMQVAPAASPMVGGGLR